MIRLSARLAAVAALVPPGASVIDVGTDHAMVPVWLVQAGICPHVLATDIRPGPLQSAAALLERTGTGDRIRLMQTDGLAGIAPEEYDALIIAGMGGETMASILSAAPWTRSGALLILAPQSKQAQLRRFLVKSGYVITAERLAADAGRVYPIFTARGGAAPDYGEPELHLGRLEQIGTDPLFGRVLDAARAQAAKAAPFDSRAAQLLEEYDRIRRELDHDHSF